MICKQIKIASPLEADTFFSAVIDEKAFNRISGFIDYAKSSSDCKIINGGSYDKSKGFYVQPTIVECSNLDNKLFNEEIFGPVLTVYVYKDVDCESILQLVHSKTNYALTGSIFAQDK